MLKRGGHKVERADNGAEALEKIMESYVHCAAGVMPYDVVLMDLQMPVMDGLEAVRRIRAEEKEKNILCGASMPPPFHQLIIGVSANSDNVTMLEAMTAGMDAFIGKPFSIDAFYEVLNTHQSKGNISKI